MMSPHKPPPIHIQTSSETPSVRLRSGYLPVGACRHV
jgi:hypothetical protein